MKAVVHAFGERAVLMLMYAALIRSAESWRGITITAFEARQLSVIKEELDPRTHPPEQRRQNTIHRGGETRNHRPSGRLHLAQQLQRSLSSDRRWSCRAGGPLMAAYGHLWPLTRAGRAAAPRPDCAMEPVRSVPSNVSSQTSITSMPCTGCSTSMKCSRAASCGFCAKRRASFMRTLALPKEVEHWSLTTLREKLVKIGAKVVSHGRYVTFQLAEVAVPSECGAGSAEGRPTTSRGWEGGHLWAPMAPHAGRRGRRAAPGLCHATRPKCAK